MGIPTDPTQAAPEAPPPPAPEPSPAIPEPPAPQVPQAIPQPPAPPTATGGLEPYQQQAAEALWRGVGDARTRPEALTTLLRQYGYLPEGVPIDHVPDVLAQYGEYLEQGAGGQMVEEQPPGLDGQPTQVDPQTQAALQRLQALEERELARAQQEEQAIVRGSVGRVAGAEGLDGTGQEILLSNVSMALARAVQAGQQIDVDRLDEWVGQVLASLRSFGQAAMNQDIAAHRRMAPNTTTPLGAPQGGGGYSTGMKGSEERAYELIRAAEDARARGA